MLLGSINFVSAAEYSKNAYGHAVTYKPQTSLYAGGEPLKLFDANITEWAALSDKITRDEAQSIKWLSSNGFLLNHFGRMMPGSK